MPLPLLALAALPALAKAGLGAYQLTQKVKRTDSTTPEEREQLGLARQMQNATLPGLASYQGRLAQTQNAAVQNAMLGAGSGSDFLAAASAADRVRQQGEAQLATQGQQYHDRANQQLNAVLGAAAARSRADTQRAEQARAQLKSAGLNNLSNALTEGSSIATYGALNSQAPAATTPGTLPTPPPTFTNDALNPYSRRAGYGRGMYGGFPY
jgi:hypothetical protein